MNENVLLIIKRVYDVFPGTPVAFPGNKLSVHYLHDKIVIVYFFWLHPSKDSNELFAVVDLKLLDTLIPSMSSDFLNKNCCFIGKEIIDTVKSRKIKHEAYDENESLWLLSVLILRKDEKKKR